LHFLQYLCEAAFDVSTCGFTDSFSVATEETEPTGLAFSTDGLKMFVVGHVGQDVNEYACEAAFDVSTCGFTDSFSVATEETEPTGLAFSADGLKMFVVGHIEQNVNEYALTTAFDLSSTVTFVDSLSVATEETNPVGLAFSADRLKMFVVGHVGQDVNEYACGTIFDVSFCDFTDSFSVATEETGPVGLAFSADGRKMFVLGDTGQDVNEYGLGTSFVLAAVSFTATSDTATQTIVTFDKIVDGTLVLSQWTFAGQTATGATANISGAVADGTLADDTSIVFTHPSITDQTPSVVYAGGDIQDNAPKPNVMETATVTATDGIGPNFVSAFLSGKKSITVNYDEPVTTVPGDYTSISVDGDDQGTATSVNTSSPDSILVKWSGAKAKKTDGITFTIGAVTDTAGNALSNGGEKVIAAQEEDKVKTKKLKAKTKDKDDDVKFTIPKDTFLERIIAPQNTRPVISFSDFDDATDDDILKAVADDEEKDATTALFPAQTITIESDDAIIEFPPSLQVLFPDGNETIVVTVSVKDPTADPDFIAAFPNVDLATANIIEFGNPDTDLIFSSAVKITIPGLSGTIFSINAAGDTKQILPCDNTVVSSATANTFIDSIIGNAITDDEACHSAPDIWTRHFSGFGSSPTSSVSSGGSGGSGSAPTFKTTRTFGFGGILVGADTDNKPIQVQQIIYDIKAFENEVEKQTVKTGVRADFEFTLFEDSGSDTIQHFAFLTNLTGKLREYIDSDTYIIYDRDDELVIKDPHGLFRDVNVDIISFETNSMTIIVSITFDKEMSESDIYLRTWNSERYSQDIKLKNAIEVISGEYKSEPIVDDVIMDTEPTLDDVIIDPEPGVAEVPDWMKKRAGWWSEDQIDDETFVQGIKFLILKGIIELPTEENVSLTTEEKEERKFDWTEEKEEVIQIPDWVKNTSGWWAQGLLSDEEFVNGIKYLVEQRIVQFN